jgi:group II intron reverse transcriptase/maturase
MLREQKTTNVGCPNECMVETKNNEGARSVTTLESVEENSARLLEKILDRDNLNAAYQRVKRNGGAAGIDGMTVDEMFPYLKEHGWEIVQNIKAGKYKPQPVRRVEIPKPDGGVRLLGVPTVIDRMIQQAIVQVLQPIFEPTFSDNSYGFRPGRNAHQAIEQAKKYYEEGYIHVVDIDLAKYFDTVNHDILIEKIREQVSDETVIKLIRKYLKSGVMLNGLTSATTEGVPQGGNLSPLLSNIYLTSFDRLLESRGLRFVRYADDCNIYVKSSRAADRVMTSCMNYLEGKLKLKVNQEKSQTGSPLALKFLGFSLCIIRGIIEISAHAKTIKRFKDKIRELTNRKQGKSISQIISAVNKYTTGWLGYYSIANMNMIIQSLNGWIRRRIRQLHWKQWKKVSARYKNLQRLGIAKGMAWQWAYTRRGYWRVAGSWILTKSLTNKYLTSIGYDDIAQRYEALHLKSLNRPIPNGT